MAVRKTRMIEIADAFVALPGGRGTLDELFEVLTLVQTGKTKPAPIILFGTRFWNRLIDFELLIEEGTISPKDLELFHRTDDPQEACDALITAGNANGGEDNITSVLVRFEKYGA